MEAAEFSALLRDLRAETDELVTLLSGLEDEQWRAPTPAVGWDVHDQVVHLAYFDDLAGRGFTDPEGFDVAAAALLATGDDWVDQISHDRAAMPPSELLEWFLSSRRSAIALFEQVGPSARSHWFGPSMSAASSATARLMETWAHGQDIYDTFGLERRPTERIRNICHLGVITRGFSYRLRGMEPPDAEVRVELVAPDGEPWTWGPADASSRISGPALDFALVVTQRRNVADTHLLVTPGPAAEWMSIAQAFAGSVGTGRPPGLFATGPVPAQDGSAP